MTQFAESCDLCGATEDLEQIANYAGVPGANLSVCRNRFSCIERQLKREEATSRVPTDREHTQSSSELLAALRRSIEDP